MECDADNKFDGTQPKIFLCAWKQMFTFTFGCVHFACRYTCERNKRVKAYLINHLVEHFDETYSPQRCASWSTIYVICCVFMQPRCNHLLASTLSRWAHLLTGFVYALCARVAEMHHLLPGALSRWAHLSTGFVFICVVCLCSQDKPKCVLLAVCMYM